MNYWTQLSIEYANNRSYLDDLFRVYPVIPEGIRDIDKDAWERFEKAFEHKDNNAMLSELLNFDLFPIKDSYVAYLKRDPQAIQRNPATVARLCGRLYEIGLSKIYENCTLPKETNRQMGPSFRRWLNRGALGLTPVSEEEFNSSDDNAILDGSDEQLKNYARKFLGYKHHKGLDLIARFNGQYVVGEAKFLTDFGGHQNAQFEDALSTIKSKCHAVKIAILDGVLYINGRNKMYNEITQGDPSRIIMSALVLREFLYQL
ncbi:MAG: hypothetical protein IJQ39_01060 [Thermoguttaceae bacterium]|nr:hypothetical protein [Thermoguttaceae bacterium]